MPWPPSVWCQVWYCIFISGHATVWNTETKPWNMDHRFDAIIVGGGILGSFHAYHALELGLKVCLVEKDAHPQGATTRNFGQVVPSGMNVKWQKFGRESLRIYKEIQAKFDIGVRQNGTVYLASDQEEEQLLM